MGFGAGTKTLVLKGFGEWGVLGYIMLMEFLATYWLRALLIGLNVMFWGYAFFFMYSEIWMKRANAPRKTTLQGRYPHSPASAPAGEEA